MWINVEYVWEYVSNLGESQACTAQPKKVKIEQKSW